MELALKVKMHQRDLKIYELVLVCWVKGEVYALEATGE